jgi:anti-sigma B factor antagonist
MSTPELKHLSVKDVNGIAVVDFVNSQLMFATSVVQEIGNELDSLVTNRGHTKIVLDFAHVQYVSSSMLAQLAKLQRTVEQAKGHLRVCGLGPVLLDTFRIGHFDRLFEICDDLESSIASFRPS